MLRAAAIASIVAALAACCLVDRVLAQTLPACPFMIKAKTSRRSLAAGSSFMLKATVAAAAEVPNVGVRVSLPAQSSVIKAAALLVPKPARQPVQADGNSIFWTSLTLAPRKNQRFKVKARLGICTPAGPQAVSAMAYVMDAQGNVTCTTPVTTVTVGGVH